MLLGLISYYDAFHHYQPHMLYGANVFQRITRYRDKLSVTQSGACHEGELLSRIELVDTPMPYLLTGRST